VSTGTALLPPRRRRSKLFRGLTPRQEHIFTWIAVVVVLLYATGWVAAIDYEQRLRKQMAVRAPVTKVPPPIAAASPLKQITTSILVPNAPTAAFITDAMMGFLDPLRGASGKVRFATELPGASIAQQHDGATAVLSSGSNQAISSDFVAPDQPGVYSLAVQLNNATRPMDDFSVITIVPFSAKQAGRIGLYYLGTWPFEHGGTPKTPAYANPAGFIEVTRQNADTQVSAHFRLRDFLTKGQNDVWPKYLLLNPKLIDKLELTIAELEKTGHPVHNMRIMSGFRTPEYNYTGGNTEGRANLSRHMFGDAADVFIDNDGNGAMDDLNHDGKVDVHDAETIEQAVSRVELAHPELVGGVGVYSACCGHGPFAHIDVRGYRARWRGTGSG
jgi:uncharacterized protein YcbK (DUF882 family)